MLFFFKHLERSCSLTTTVSVEADGRSGQAIHEVSSRTGLHVHTAVPLAAVVVKAGTGSQGDDAVMELGVVAVEPDGSMRAAVILRDAERGHGIPGHACEAIPFPRHVAVTHGLVGVVLSVPPGFIQADVGRARVQGWGWGRQLKQHHNLKRKDFGLKVIRILSEYQFTQFKHDVLWSESVILQFLANLKNSLNVFRLNWPTNKVRKLCMRSSA